MRTSSPSSSVVQLALVGHSLSELVRHLDTADVAADDVVDYVAADIVAGDVVGEVVDCCTLAQLQPAEQRVVGALAHADPTLAGLANFDAVAVSFASV